MTSTVFGKVATELRKARISKKITRQKIAKQLHVPVATVVQLENPAKSSVPASYSVGLYRRYAALMEFSPRKVNKWFEDIDVKEPKRTNNNKARTNGTLIVTNTVQKVTAAVVIVAIVIYAMWQFGVLFAPPNVEITNLGPREVTNSSTFMIEGKSDPDAAVFINGDPVTVAEDGSFVVQLYLQPGYNSIEVNASNNFSRTRTLNHVIILQPDENLPTPVDDQG